MVLWTQNGFVEDAYVRVASLGDAPAEGSVLVPLALWRSDGAALTSKCASVGVELPASKDAPGALAELVGRPLIALQYSKFGDGRAFSYARLLRARLGYRGEIRAVGDVLFDELGFMLRVGFDSFEIANEPTLKALREGKTPIVPLVYQPGLARRETRVTERPWTRKLAG